VNHHEAKKILLLYRPGTADSLEPAVEEAIDLARQDTELSAWFEQHQAFQQAMRTKLRQIEAPEHLKAAVLAETKIIRPTIWRQTPVWLAVAAAIALLVGYIGFWQRSKVPDHFADYRKMMVAKAEGQYGMQWETSDMDQLRKHFAEQGAPADYRLPQGLEKSQLLGGVKLSWRTHPVAMICFQHTDKTPVWLFVMDKAAVKNAPPGTEVNKVDRFQTVSWTGGNRVYILTGPDERGFGTKYF